MMARRLTARVTLMTALAVLPLALAGGWLGGAPGALGVLAGGALALFSFHVVAGRATAASPRRAWLVVAMLRFAVVTAAAAFLFASGWAHPLALLVGYSTLPVSVLGLGLRLASEDG